MSGKKKSQPQPAPDNLRSDDQMEAIIGLCEGEIEGFYEGDKSLRLSETPFRNEDGSSNFVDASVTLYTGQPDQGPIVPALGGLSRSRTVNVQLNHNVPVTRQTFGGTPVHFVDVRLVVNALYSNSDQTNGNIPCRLVIKHKQSITTAWNQTDVFIQGKTSSNPFVKEVRIPVNTNGDADRGIPIDIQVILVSDNLHETTQQVSWESFQEVQEASYKWNNTAILHFRSKASNQLSGLPDISGIYKLMRVRVPSNYDTSTRQYSGMWDGSWKIAWTDNPAYCLYDLVMNDRYGLNHYGPITLNKWDVYRAGKFCDKFVPSMVVGLDGQPVEMPPHTLREATLFGLDAYSKQDATYGHDSPNNPELDTYGIRLPFEFYGETKRVGWDITFPVSGSYTAYIYGDDTASLSIDNRTIVQHVLAGDNPHPGDWTTATFNAEAGSKVAVVSIYNSYIGGHNSSSDNPHFAAAYIKNASGTIIWHSRMTPIAAPRCREGWTYDANLGLCVSASGTTPTEPRFTFNGLIADQRPAMEQVRYLAGSFHGVLYDDLDGTLRLCVPDETPTVAIFNQENVVDGVFDYSFTDLVNRYNDWTASFINPELMWVEDRIRLTDDNHVNKYGRLATDYIAVGCINRSEAIRRTLYRMRMAIDQRTMVKFRVNRQGCYLKPFDRVRISDKQLSGYQSGRVKEVSQDGTSLVLFDTVDFGNANSWMVYQTPGGHSSSYPIYSRGVSDVVILARPIGTQSVVTPGGDHVIQLSDDGKTAAEFYDETREVSYYLDISTSGSYTLHLWGDDVATAFIDGTQTAQASLSDRAAVPITLTTGTHTIRLTIYNANITGNNNPINNPHYIGSYITSTDGSVVWSTHHTNKLAGAELPPEPNFPVNIFSGGEERIWRVIDIGEDEGDPDNLTINCIEDWSFDGYETTSDEPASGWVSGVLPGDPNGQPGGDTNPANTPAVPPAITGCPSFSTEWPADGAVIRFTPPLAADFHRYNGQYVVRSRLAGSGGDWLQRSTVANGIYNHPRGAVYEFKILPQSDTGAISNFDQTPACVFAVPQCPPASALGVPTGVGANPTYDGSTQRWSYTLVWTEGGLYTAGTEIKVYNGNTLVRTQEVSNDFEPIFIYTGAMQIQDGLADSVTTLRFEFRYIDECGSRGEKAETTGSRPPPPVYGPSNPLEMNCGEVQKAVLAGTLSKATEHTVAVGGSVTLDVSLCNVFTINVTGGAGDVTINVSNSTGCNIASDKARGIIVMVRNVGGGDKTINYTVSPLKWRDGEDGKITSVSGSYTMHLLLNTSNAWFAGRGGRQF